MSDKRELQMTLWKCDDCMRLIEIAVSRGRPIATITGPFVWAFLCGLRWCLVKALEHADG